MSTKAYGDLTSAFRTTLASTGRQKLKIQLHAYVFLSRTHRCGGRGKGEVASFLQFWFHRFFADLQRSLLRCRATAVHGAVGPRPDGLQGQFAVLVVLVGGGGEGRVGGGDASPEAKALNRSIATNDNHDIAKQGWLTLAQLASSEWFSCNEEHKPNCSWGKRGVLRSGWEGVLPCG